MTSPSITIIWPKPKMNKSLLHILFSAVVLIMASVPAFSQNTSAQESRKARLEEEIRILDKQIQQNTKNQNKALSNLTLVKKKIASRNDLIAESDREIATIEDSIRVKGAEIAVLQARLDTMSFYYTRLVKNAYKNRDARVWYMYILGSENLGQAFRRFGYLHSLSEQMNTQAKKIIATKDELLEKKGQMEKMRSSAQKMRNIRMGELTKLQAEEKESNQLVNTLRRSGKKYKSDLEAKRKQVEALNREIEKIIKAAMAQNQSKKNKKAQAPIDYTLANEFAANKGKLPWPVNGPVIDGYGQHFHPVYKNVKLPFNNGITIATNDAEPVKAVFDGVVKQIVVMPGYNQCVLVQHGNYFSFYCKMGSVSVKAGDKVKTGQVLGKVGAISGEAQFHLQIWYGKTPQNPQTWLRPR